MRVELPSPNPGGPPASATPETSPATAIVPKARPVGTVERWVTTITRPRWIWSIATLTIALFVWSLAIRRPAGERYLAVSARALALGGGHESLTNLTSADLQHLRQEVDDVKKALVKDRKELLPLLFSLETTARREGWRCERSMMPVQTYANTLTNLELHPVVFRLYPTTAVTPGLYTPLLRWLHAVSDLEKRAEIASLNVQADASGIQRADVRIHFFSLNRNEETPSK